MEQIFELRSKAFFLTYSNLQEEVYSLETCQSFLDWIVSRHVQYDDATRRYPKLTYAIACMERHENGVPHIHCILTFEQTKQLAVNVSIFYKSKYRPRLERIKSLSQSIDYVRKEGLFVEWGVIPPTFKRKVVAPKLPTKLEDIPLEIRVDRIENFKFMSQPTLDLLGVGGISFDQSLQHDKTMRMINMLSKQTQKTRDLEVYWIYGPTAIGKSYYVRERHKPEDLYIKSSTTKWWDGYTGQPAVLLEEVEKTDMDVDLKKWTDNYVFQAEIKGSTISGIAYSVIYLTSNYHPSELWKKKLTGYCTSSLGLNFNAEAIMRRLNIVTILGSIHMVNFDLNAPLPQKVVATSPEILEMFKGTNCWLQYMPIKKIAVQSVPETFSQRHIDYLANLNKI